ncbi:MAG: hypothetical protein IPK32_23315 [Verrucomicrobiaceae bacterium]|nr:hypothetical protein [Verrucomicrobiaceae bacterium]
MVPVCLAEIEYEKGHNDKALELFKAASDTKAVLTSSRPRRATSRKANL